MLHGTCEHVHGDERWYISERFHWSRRLDAGQLRWQAEHGLWAMEHADQARILDHEALELVARRRSSDWQIYCCKADCAKGERTTTNCARHTVRQTINGSIERFCRKPQYP